MPENLEAQFHLAFISLKIAKNPAEEQNALKKLGEVLHINKELVGQFTQNDLDEFRLRWVNFYREHIQPLLGRKIQAPRSTFINEAKK